MRFSTTFLLLAASAGTLVSAGIDFCHPTYCKLGDSCHEDIEGAHCCDGLEIRDVLQCQDGKWQIRNACENPDDRCACTSDNDIICEPIFKPEPAPHGGWP
ncbi:hypothetical protein PG993_013750 [Apiospora rasikravindrae]|uniref:Uncharacterized protein n=1 Tax=Apiospora rasikravindrae TaxID=990691 RepID=A0ABR1RR46_9PEZI